MNDAAFSRVPHSAALYVGLVQFLFVTCWTVYVIFLPGLLETSGISRRYTIWILMQDQLIFMLVVRGMRPPGLARRRYSGQGARIVNTARSA
jgi:hypothetical protein